MYRLLIVEDEDKLRRYLQEGLQEQGFDVRATSDGSEGCRLASTESFDLVLLDLMLPNRSGLEILSELRCNGFNLPILILTARDSIENRVEGLESGADDYLVKPFAFAELLARIHALLRRAAVPRTEVLRVADLKLDPVRRCVIRGETELELSTREFELLEYLIRHANETLSRETIAHDIWKEPGPVETNVIDVYINYLRKKIERPGERQLIHTVRGVGYCLRDES